MTNSAPTPVLAASLRLTGGFHDAERAHLLEVLAPLEKHLARWTADEVALELYVTNRGRPEQRVTLEAKLGGWPLLVAKGADADLDQALREARTELIRQIEDERSRHLSREHRR
jgi:ribosome-associated translation inhibitor RaiA